MLRSAGGCSMRPPRAGAGQATAAGARSCTCSSLKGSCKSRPCTATLGRLTSKQRCLLCSRQGCGVSGIAVAYSAAVVGSCDESRQPMLRMSLLGICQPLHTRGSPAFEAAESYGGSRDTPGRARPRALVDSSPNVARLLPPSDSSAAVASPRAFRSARLACTKEPEQGHVKAYIQISSSYCADHFK